MTGAPPTGPAQGPEPGPAPEQAPELAPELAPEPAPRPAAPVPVTPVLVKVREDETGPPETTHYVLSSDGLFLHRANAFFTSCTPVREWPPELAGQQTYLAPRFPRLSRRQYERIVGFFSRVADLHGAEAALLLVWDRQAEEVVLHVPRQWTLVDGLGVRYQPPSDLPPHQVVYGDVHCHVNAPAYASHVDVHDEEHAAGLHLVVGRIRSEPPELHVEAVVDGVRFPLEATTVVAGYRRRDLDVPEAWLDRVRLERSADRPPRGVIVGPVRGTLPPSPDELLPGPGGYHG